MKKEKTAMPCSVIQIYKVNIVNKLNKNNKTKPAEVEVLR